MCPRLPLKPRKRPLQNAAHQPMLTHLHDAGLGPTHVVVEGRTSSLKTASSAWPPQAVYQSARGTPVRGVRSPCVLVLSQEQITPDVQAPLHQLPLEF